MKSPITYSLPNTFLLFNLWNNLETSFPSSTVFFFSKILCSFFLILLCLFLAPLHSTFQMLTGCCAVCIFFIVWFYFLWPFDICWTMSLLWSPSLSPTISIHLLISIPDFTKPFETPPYSVEFCVVYAFTKVFNFIKFPPLYFLLEFRFLSVAYVIFLLSGVLYLIFSKKKMFLSSYFLNKYNYARMNQRRLKVFP